MKKWFSYSAIFFSVYSLFLIATMPVHSLFAFVQLPNNISIKSLTGTVWQANIKQLAIEVNKSTKQQISIHDINAELSFLSLLMFNPNIELSFGGALVAGPEGKLMLTNLLTTPSIEQAEISMSAKMVAEQLTLPIPLSAKGHVDLNLELFTLGKPVCAAAKGNISWQKASINAFEQNVSLGNLSADLACDKGALAINIDKKNDLGLSFIAYLRQAGQVSGNGYLTPGVKFPAALKTVLPFLGQKDNQGRYRLMF
jgi:general secretion pathway protein N